MDIQLNVTVLISIFCLLVFVVHQSDATQQANGLYFGNNFGIDIANASSSNVEGQITSTEKGDVYVVWVDKNSIYFSSTNENVTNFSNAFVLSSNNSVPSSPRLGATEKGDVYVVWVDKNNSTGNSNIVFRGSNDSGNSFENGVLLNRDVTQNQTSSTTSFSPQIAATEKGDVYVVWVDEKNTTGDSNIEFIRSNDSGKIFSNRIILRSGDILSYSPQITATEKGDVYVVWVDESKKTGDSDISFRSSSDSGRNFEDRKRLRSSDTLLSSSPQIAATEKGDVYVVWVDKNSTIEDSDITFRSSTDRGADFKRAVNLNSEEKKLYNDSSPQIVTTGKDRVNIAWANNHIEFKEILVQDTRLGVTVILSNISSWSSSPQLTATEKGDVYVIWVDKDSTADISLIFKRISEYYFARNS